MFAICSKLICALVSVHLSIRPIGAVFGNSHAVMDVLWVCVCACSVNDLKWKLTEMNEMKCNAIKSNDNELIWFATKRIQILNAKCVHGAHDTCQSHSFHIKYTLHTISILCWFLFEKQTKNTLNTSLCVLAAFSWTAANRTFMSFVFKFSWQK